VKVRLEVDQNNLYIQKLLTVIKGHNTRHHKLLKCESRHSDAFVYILSGSCTDCVEGEQEFTVNPGDILYLARNAAYTMYILSENYQFLFCDFEFADEMQRKSGVYRPEQPSDAENLFYKLLQFYTRGSGSSFSDCMATLYQIYGMVLHTANRQYVGNSAASRMEEIQVYIDSNYMDGNLCVEILAEKAGMSQVYLRRLFKAKYGCQPSRYITSVRLAKAKELMRYSFLSLEDCAVQSGFSSVQYFCRVFKKEFGVTPANYRRK
jgi:AraC-like DNA-binding protein